MANPPRNTILWFFLICFAVSIFMIGWLLLPFFSIIILGAVLTGVFYPIYRIMINTRKIRPALASLVTCILIFFLVFVPIVFTIGSLTQQAYGLYLMARGSAINEQIGSLLADTRILQRANIFLENFNYQITGEQLQNAISEIGKFVGLFLYEQARAIASNTVAFVVSFLLMLLVTFFLLIDGARLLAYIVDLSPLPSEQDYMLINKFNDMAGALLIGNGFTSLLQGGLGGLWFWFFGFNSAFLWGVIMALLAFLPLIGIGAIFVPTAIYLFLKGSVATSILFVVFYLIVSGTAEYVIKPRMVGKQVKMHPLLVFFSIIGGLKAFGILGIIYGPLVVTAFITLADIYRTSYQRLIETQ